MTLFGFAALLAPVVGPTLGGWITDSYNWRWCFLINVPVGILAFGGSYAVLRDPDYLVAERAELRKQPFRADSIGLSLLAIVIVCWEVMLSKGQGVGLAGRLTPITPPISSLSLLETQVRSTGSTGVQPFDVSLNAHIRGGDTGWLRPQDPG